MPPKSDCGTANFAVEPANLQTMARHLKAENFASKDPEDADRKEFDVIARALSKDEGPRGQLARALVKHNCWKRVDTLLSLSIIAEDEDLRTKFYGALFTEIVTTLVNDGATHEDVRKRQYTSLCENVTDTNFGYLLSQIDAALQAQLCQRIRSMSHVGVDAIGKIAMLCEQQAKNEALELYQHAWTRNYTVLNEVFHWLQRDAGYDFGNDDKLHADGKTVPAEIRAAFNAKVCDKTTKWS